MSSAASPSDGGWSPSDRREAAWNIVDIINDAHRGGDDVGGLPPFDVLPGFGGNTRFTCGDPRSSFCVDHGHLHDSRTTCDRSTCSHCAPNWARRRATYICRKIAALRAMLDPAGAQGTMKYHHLAISFQKKGEEAFRFEGGDEDEVRNRMFQATYDIMDELDIQGIVIYHPGVGKDGDDRGFWKDFLGTRTDWLEAREELMHHPHVHVLGVSEFVPGEGVTELVEAETEWVINRITRGGDDSDDNVSLGDNLDLARAVTYSLSHCGIYETDGGQMRYAGRFHGADVDGAKVKERYKMEWERAVRTVAPKTLGLNKRDLLCSSDAVASTQTSIGSFDSAQARMRAEAAGSSGTEGADDFAGSNVGATGEVIVESSGPVADDDTVLPDDPDVSVTVDIPEGPCEAPLYDIARAPAFLSDDEWVEEAQHADDVRDAYLEWKIGQDFLQQTDEDLQAIQDGRPEDASIEWPPPD